MFVRMKRTEFNELIIIMNRALFIFMYVITYRRNDSNSGGNDIQTYLRNGKYEEIKSGKKRVGNDLKDENKLQTITQWRDVAVDESTYILYTLAQILLLS